MRIVGVDCAVQAPRLRVSFGAIEGSTVEIAHVRSVW